MAKSRTSSPLTGIIALVVMMAIVIQYAISFAVSDQKAYSMATTLGYTDVTITSKLPTMICGRGYFTEVIVRGEGPDGVSRDLRICTGIINASLKG